MQREEVQKSHHAVELAPVRPQCFMVEHYLLCSGAVDSSAAKFHIYLLQAAQRRSVWPIFGAAELLLTLLLTLRGCRQG